MIGDDLVGWGASISSFIEPIVRTITCPCGLHMPMRDYLQVLYDTNAISQVRWVDDTIQGLCPKCRKSVKFHITDTIDKDGKFTCIRWPLRYCDINKIQTSSGYRVLLRTKDYREFSDPIRKMDVEALCTTPIDIVRAVMANDNFIFDENAVCVLTLKQPCELQRKIGGWGLPMFLSDFGTAMIVLMLDRSCEAIASDMLLPFRLMTPALPTQSSSSGAQGGPLATLKGGDIASRLQALYERHRINPTSIATFPIPIQEVIIGGNASQLAPVQLMEHYEHRLLDSMSIPYTLRSAASATAAPATSEEISLQLFKHTWAPIRNLLSTFASFAVQQIGRSKKWEKVTTNLLPQESAVDMQLKELMLSMAASNEMPKTLVYRKVFNMDWRASRKRIQQEERWLERQMAKDQKERESEGVNMQSMATPPAGAAIAPPQGAAPAPGAPMPPQGAAPAPMGTAAPPMPASIEELMAQADQPSQQLFTMDYPSRRKALNDIKKSNETLHAQVKAKLDTMASQAASAGVQAARSGQMQ